MGLGVVHLLSLLLIVAVHKTYSEYVAFVPESTRPGWLLKVPVTVKNTEMGNSVTVRGDILDSGKVSQVSDTIEIANGETGMLGIPVSNSLMPGGTYSLKIEGSGGLKFTNSTEIKIDAHIRQVFVQTDKPLYKPKDLVRFRVFVVDRDLKVLKVPKIIRVKNPDASILRKYTDDAKKAVFADTFQLEDYSKQGDWRFEVQIDDDKEEIPFKVKEYVLPRFEVMANVEPGFLVKGGEKTKVTVSVAAKYTYGKGVTGDVELIPPPSARIRKDLKGTIEDPNRPIEIPVDFSDELRDLTYDKQVDIVVKVTDETNQDYNITVTVKLSKDAIKVKFVKKHSDAVYRIGTDAKVVVKVTDPNDMPLSDDKRGRLTVSLKDYSNEENSQELSKDLTEGKNGYYTWVFQDIKMSNSYDLQLTATLRMSDGKVYTAPGFSLLKYQTLGNATLNAKWISSSMDIGDTAHFAVDLHNGADFDPDSFMYLITSRGSILTHGTMNNMGDTPVIITREMCPKANIIVAGMTSSPTAELIADRLKLELTGCQSKKVTPSSPTTRLKTGETATINMDVQWTDPARNGESVGEHNVHMLAMDKSLTLLGEGNNDITPGKVDEALGKFNIGSDDDDHDEVQPMWREKRSIWPGPGYMTPTTTGGLLKNVGLNVLADVSMKDDFWYDRDGPIILFREAAAGGAGVPENEEIKKKGGAENERESAGARDQVPKKVTTVRKFFPEAWIWMTKQTDGNGHLSFTQKVPDTITSWVISAFAERDDEELAVTVDPFELVAYRPFFVTMSLPYSIRRNESFKLRCTVFNYLDVVMETKVTLMPNTTFDIVGPKSVQVMVKPNTADSVEFKIKGTTVTTISLEVMAHGRSMDRQSQPLEYTDIVTKPLIVKPEGEKHIMVDTWAAVIPSDLQSKEKNVNLYFPDNTVPQSKTILVKIVGDMMGDMLNNIESLVRQPYGCGEQNMISVVPNIAAMDYLTAINAADAETKAKAIGYMKSGYHREETYRWELGGYSAFGSSDDAPSTWLTAFVLKSFAQASKYIGEEIDWDKMEQTVRFLQKQETGSGEFMEEGKVLHSEMMGGTASGLSFHVYVTMSLLEAKRRNIPVDQGILDRALDNVAEKVDTFLRDDPTAKMQFVAAISAYTLSLQTSYDSNRIIRLLNYVVNAGAPWKKDDGGKEDGERRPVPYNQPAKASDIETTSYYILAKLALNKLGDAHEPAMWLQQQQNENGGFRSTQDTVTALQAISEFAAKTLSSSDSTVMITARGTGGVKTIEKTVNDVNRRILQIEELPDDVFSINMRVAGPNSVTMVKVVWTYYTIPDDEGTGGLFINSVAKVIRKGLTEYKNCMGWTTDGNQEERQGMYMLSLLPPTLMELNDIQQAKEQNMEVAKRIEVDKNGQIDIYVEGLVEEKCFTVVMFQENAVENSQPGVAYAYNYYRPDEVKASVEMKNMDDDGECPSCPTDHAAPLASQSSLLLTVTMCLLMSLRLVL